MQLQEILYSQGFGTRRVCAGLIQQGLVQVYANDTLDNPTVCKEAAAEFEATGLRFKVQGSDWPYFEKAYVLRGYDFMLLEDKNAAVDNFTKALKLNPNSSLAKEYLAAVKSLKTLKPAF